MEPKWIKIDILKNFHKTMIAIHGGLKGIRDVNVLDSSCASPKHLYHYKNPKPSIAELGAKYAYSVLKNHPFVDGNKRMALIALDLFLILNSYELKAPPMQIYFNIMGISRGSMKEEEFIDWVIKNVREI